MQLPSPPRRRPSPGPARRSARRVAAGRLVAAPRRFALHCCGIRHEKSPATHPTRRHDGKT
eukprot:740839-Pyramimonas_sp.AAC.1